MGAKNPKRNRLVLSGFADLFVNQFAANLGIPDAGFPGPSDTSLLFPIGENQEDFEDVSIRAGVEYSCDEASMLYVSYAEGYKTGGWTTRLGAPVSFSAILAGRGAGSGYGDNR